MERYDEYKDSGVEWIGEIPAGWSIVPLKSLASFRKGLSITKADLSDVGKPVLSYGQIHSKRHVSSGIEKQLIRYVPESCNALAPAAFAEEGSVIFADTSEDVEGCGNCAYVDVRDGIYAGYHTIIASFRQIRGLQYFGYLFMTDAWRSQVRSLASGVKLYSITQKMLKTTSVCLPPFVERTAIADYLDAKTANVDAAISDCEREVELLQEYRKAVISEVVTKGLDPSASMKDSGIEWIGKIPEVWDVARLKQLVRMQTGKTPSSSTPRYFDGSFPWFTPGDLQQFKVVESSRSVNISAISDGVLDFIPKGSTLLVCVGYSSGKASIAKVDCCTNQQITALIPIAINGGYLAYCSICFGQELLNLATFNRVPLMNNEFIGSVKVPVPSIPEQRAIVAYLDEKTTEIDALIAGYQSMADKLREYRKSLISEAVTGKFKVPGV